MDLRRIAILLATTAALLRTASVSAQTAQSENTLSENTELAQKTGADEVREVKESSTHRDPASSKEKFRSKLLEQDYKEPEPTDRWQPDPNDVLNIKIGALTPQLSMGTSSGSNSDVTSVEYLPSTSSKTFIGVGYRNLGFYLSKSNGRSDDEINRMGAGDSTDILLQFFGRTWTQQYFYQSYSGYYISNTSVVDPSHSPAGSNITRPDIQTAHYGVNIMYNFQPGNYSPGAAYNQSGRQIQSGGAWLVMASLHNHKFSSRPQLLPSTVSASYKELATLESGDLLQGGLAAGGGYTWTFWNGWFLNGQLLYGYGGVYQNFETAEYRYKKNGSSTVANGSVSFGYNGVNNYVVFQSLQDAYTYSLPSLGLRISASQYAVLYGHRFSGVNLPWANRWSSWLD